MTAGRGWAPADRPRYGARARFGDGGRRTVQLASADRWEAGQSGETGETTADQTSRTGAVIAAASHRVARPIAKLGDLSLIQRLTLAYQRAGVDRVVVVTGFEDPEIKARLTDEGVVFVNLLDSLDTELIDSYRIGLDYLAGSCQRVFLTPVNVPMYRPSTIRALLDAPGPAVVPTHKGRAGHPVLIDADLADAVLAYQGPDGLAGLLRSSAIQRHGMEVEDEGILHSVAHQADLERLVAAHDESLIQPWFRLGIRKAGVVVDSRTLLLLRLIGEVHSVRAPANGCRSRSPEPGAWSTISKVIWACTWSTEPTAALTAAALNRARTAGTLSPPTSATSNRSARPAQHQPQ